MEDKVYYDKLQSMVDKAKELKQKIELNQDSEAKGYLRLALEVLYTDMRELIKERDSKR
jgi:hypothetical protein